MNVVLISTYDLGHQPFALASAAAWLRADGHTVVMADVSIDAVPLKEVRQADVVALSLPMHTATRLAAQVVKRVRDVNPSARLCAFGLYAGMNAEFLWSIGIHAVFGGEFEQALAAFVSAGKMGSTVSLDRLQFVTPDRRGLPGLQRYAKLHINGAVRTVGYTEASRGCKHHCRHCPVVPVYNGAFRVVQREVVLEDVRRQVAAGAQHITFGDPDFFNGPSHALRLVEAMHREHPEITWDATIKIEHLLQQRHVLAELRSNGCLFITSAVESVDDAVLARLEKGHTRADFIEVSKIFAEVGLALSPTFIPFTPWTTRAGYLELLKTIAELGLVSHVSPIQLTLRLLLPPGSRLLELPDIAEAVRYFDQPALLYRWTHGDPTMDTLAADALRLVHHEQRQYRSRPEIFRKLWELATSEPLYEDYRIMPRAAIPYMDEPWYC